MPSTLAERAFNMLPLPIFGLVLLLMIGAAMWAGQRARRLWSDRQGDRGSPGHQEDFVVSASLGLLALLLGFTFSMAVDRFDVRRSMVTQEANAISSTYLMAQTFSEPHRGRISEILRSYTAIRLVAAGESDREKLARLMDLSRDIKAQFWAAALAATTERRDDVSSAFLQTGFNMLEVASQREGARRAVIPARVHLVTVAFLLITAMVVGSAHTSGAPRVSAALMALFTLTMMLIIDLDRPTGGAIRESQRAMELLKEDLKANTPGQYQRRQDAWARGLVEPGSAP